MLLSKKTSIKVSREYANLIGHMCYAASKLWNVCNYERQHYKETGMEQYPDWYYQKKAHKEELWYKQLPSQTAQEVCRLLDKAWKSFYALKRSGGIETPRPPRFKQCGRFIKQKTAVRSAWDPVKRNSMFLQLYKGTHHCIRYPLDLLHFPAG